MTECSFCGALLPNGLSNCRECGRETGWVDYPDNPNWWDEDTAQHLVEKAESETISREKLTKKKSRLLSRLASSKSLRKRRTADRPIIGYLTPGEVPHYLFTGNYESVVRDRAETRYLRPEISSTEFLTSWGYKPIILITDKRILSIHTYEGTDGLISAPIDMIVDIEVHHTEPDESSGGFLNPDASTYMLKITTTGSKFEFYIDNEYDTASVNSAVRLISELTTTSDEMGNSGNSQGNNRTRQYESKTTNSLTETVVQSSQLEEIREHRENVDWATAIKTGLRVGAKTIKYARVPNQSTPVIVGAATLGATTLKAHHTISGENPSIDPEKLLEQGITGAGFGNNYDMSGLSEGKFGASVGASRYLAERLSPEDYKHWVMRTNPETIMKGASVGSKISQKSSLPLNQMTGALAGGCAGLIYSYAPEDSPIREIDPESILNGTELRQLMD